MGASDVMISLSFIISPQACVESVQSCVEIDFRSCCIDTWSLVGAVHVL